MERCPSGRWCNLGKIVWGQLHRGFESPPLRIKKGFRKGVFFNSGMRTTKQSFVRFERKRAVASKTLVFCGAELRDGNHAFRWRSERSHLMRAQQDPPLRHSFFGKKRRQKNYHILSGFFTEENIFMFLGSILTIIAV